jgi:hypothetical protein
MAIYNPDSGATAKKRSLTDQLAAMLGGGGYQPPGGTATIDPSTVARPAGGFPAYGANQPASGSSSGSSTDPFSTNPGYLAALAAEQAGSQQADAALRAAQEQAIVGYGDPSLAAALGFNVDENTSAAARANYLAGNSSLARLDRQRDLNQQGNINNLAAHGILFSGELGYQQGQIGRNYGNAVYDTQQQLLAGLNNLGAQTAATKQGLHSQTIGALTNAYDQMVANPSAYAGVTAGAPVGSTPVAAQLGAAPLPNQGSGPYIGTATAAPKSRLGKAPLTNPYTTGQKRFG